ncbi:MAG: hypothetical protein M3376_09780, partial [Actinomycetota bacterium]|nr:hypothetical protein [Actinomycetota bacterium]
MRHKPFSVRRDFYRDVAAIALHLQVILPSRFFALSAAKNPCTAGRSGAPTTVGALTLLQDPRLAAQRGIVSL